MKTRRRRKKEREREREREWRCWCLNEGRERWVEKTAAAFN